MAFVSVDQMPHFKGNRGTKTLLGNREHKKVFISRAHPALSYCSHLLQMM